VGYWVLPEHRGRGLTGRALRLLSEWALGAVGLMRLELLTNLDNIGSQQVALRCGYHFEGTLRSYSIGRFGRETLHMYSRIAEDR
jgi:RimJ/RimL family protein N-acetyltransferase